METQGRIIGFKEASKRLKEASKILIISHRSPDGDTTGSGFALFYGLKQLGKEVKIICSDPFPKGFSYLYDDINQETLEENFEPNLIVSVDLADRPLFGNLEEEFAAKTDLCIDHHISNSLYAKETLLKSEASSTCEVMADLFKEINIKLNPQISNCLYTGILTDTGGFMYSCTSAHTHLVAADLIEAGAQYVQINKAILGTKTRAKIDVERQIYDRIEFFENGKIAFVKVPISLVKSGIEPEELESVPSLLSQIEGVEIAIILKEQEEPDFFKVSIRTSEQIDATHIAGQFGGGGHIRASGCAIKDTEENAKAQLLKASEEIFQGEKR